jgi:hypothetical protein
VRAKERDDALEVLNGMTKGEIIAWLSEQVGLLLRPPRKSELLFARHNAAFKAAMARREKNVLESGVAAKIDALRTGLNRAKCHKEFAAIAKELEPYNRKLKAWLDESKAIRKDEEKAEALYAAYMEQSEKERAAASREESREGGAP